MRNNRAAFTLIEVLISIALLGLILPALHQSVDLLRDSNHHLKQYLYKTKQATKAIKTLYLDIASSDGNLTMRNGEFDRLCIERTKNSLYGLSVARVCWVVLKKEHTLVRAEGNDYHLPVALEEHVEVDPVMQNLSLFDIYRQKGKVLVLIQQESQEPITFMVQGITKPKLKPKKKKKLKTKSKKASSQDQNGSNALPSETTDGIKK